MKELIVYKLKIWHKGNIPNTRQTKMYAFLCTENASNDLKDPNTAHKDLSLSLFGGGDNTLERCR
jgi:hypothetical protein